MVTTTRYSMGRRLLSAVLLAGLVLGVPAVLLAFAGNPLPSHLPTVGEVTHALATPDDGTLLLDVLVVLAWVAWAVFVFLVALEVPAQLSGRRAPRLPGLGGMQGGARWLVAPLLGVAAMTGVGTAASAVDSPAATATTASTAAPGVEVAAGDTLWDLAEEHLGDGARWQEIYDLNRDVVDDKDLILAGQQLRLPGGKTVVAPAASKPAERPAPAPAVDRSHLGPVGAVDQADRRVMEQFAQATTAPAEASQTAPASGSSAEAPAPVGAARPAAQAPSPRAQVPSEAPTPAQVAEDPAGTEEAEEGTRSESSLLGISALGAVGLLGILGAARALQRRRRKPGERIVMPTEETAELEADLAENADVIGAEDLDRALRTLAHSTAQAGQPLPGLRAARLTTTHVELFCSAADVRLPDPFVAVDDVAGVFLLERSRIGDLLDDQAAADVPAPYPALFTLGRDEEDAWVLLNLEQVGSLGLDGPEEECRAVLAAAALELIASTWADDLRVTLVGDMQDLAQAMSHDRVDYAESVAEILAPVAYAAAAHGRNLTRAGIGDVTQARGAGVADETWTPHLILLGTEPTPDERDQLAELVTSTPRVAVATITTHTEPLTEWELQMTTDSQAVLHPVGMSMWVQRVHPGQYDELVELLGLTQQPATPGPQWTSSLTDTQVIPTTTDSGATALPDLEALHGGADQGPAGGLMGEVFSLNDTPATGDGDGDGDEQEDAGGGQGAHPMGPTTNDEDTPVTEPDEDTGDQQDETTPAPPAEEDTDPTPTTEDETDTEAKAEEVGTVTSLPTQGPMIRLLGEVDILDATGKRPRSPGVTAEAIAFLALHPTDDRDELDAALWPNSTPADSTRAARISQARTWLGTTPDGAPYIPMVDEAGYRLSDAVRVDWHQMLQLIGQDITTTSTADLQQALDLVTGPPISGVAPKRYAWAATDREEMIATIGDIAATLADRHLNAGRPTKAATAADTALSIDPANEALWRYRLRAADRLGEADSLMQTMTDTLEAVDGDLDPETIALMEQVAHTDRRAHA